MAAEKNLTERINLEILRYANCWEDADILLEGLNPEPESVIISIASAGDNCFSLLTTNPAKVIAIDINPVQLYLTEIKKVCFRKLEYAPLLSFIGCKAGNDRVEIYKKSLRESLSVDAAKYWDKNLWAIKQGIIFSGKFEKYFRFFSQIVLPLIHSKATVNELLNPKTAGQQNHFYHSRWNNIRWKLLFKIFFSRFVMGRFGRDPEMMSEVKTTVHDFIFNKAEAHLSSTLSQRNPYLEFILTGNFKNHLPHYLREENYQAIRNNLDKLEIRQAYLEDVLGIDSYHYLNLSNIFEYMNPAAFVNLAEKIDRFTPPGIKIAYWNLMVHRKVSEIPGVHFYCDEMQCNLLRESDKGFFYDGFFVEQKV